MIFNCNTYFHRFHITDFIQWDTSITDFISFDPQTSFQFPFYVYGRFHFTSLHFLFFPQISFECIYDSCCLDQRFHSVVLPLWTSFHLLRPSQTPLQFPCYVYGRLHSTDYFTSQFSLLHCTSYFYLSFRFSIFHNSCCLV